VRGAFRGGRSGGGVREVGEGGLERIAGFREGAIHYARLCMLGTIEGASGSWCRDVRFPASSYVAWEWDGRISMSAL
jgi:hypothetical protein